MACQQRRPSKLTRGTLNTLGHGGLDPFSGVFDPVSSASDHAICTGVHGNEFGETDYNKFRVLARRESKAGVLSAATGGRLEHSDRYRNMLAPLNYEHELRLALSDHSALWGGIALLREPGSPDFTPTEAGHLASLGRVLGTDLVGLVDSGDRAVGLGVVSPEAESRPMVLVVDSGDQFSP